jgi:hypothetical protein
VNVFYEVLHEAWTKTERYKDMVEIQTTLNKISDYIKQFNLTWDEVHELDTLIIEHSLVSEYQGFIQGIDCASRAIKANQ